jgi:WD40 repeat protein
MIVPAFAGALVLGVSACDNIRPASSNGTKAVADTAPAAVPTDIGEPLYPPAPVKPQPPAPARAKRDPIIVRQCQVTLQETQNVPSKNSGRLLEFCTEIQKGEVVPQDEIIPHPRTKERFRRLKEGDIIKAGALVGFLDDKLASANLAIEEAAQVANKAKLDAAGRLKEASNEEYQMYLTLWNKGAGSESDMRRSKAGYYKAQADEADAKGQLLKSEQEFNKARVVLEEHEVRSTIGGMVKRFYRKPGESIKELEPVAEVWNTDKVRVEGLLDPQNVYILNQAKTAGKTLKAIIETAPQVGQAQQRDGHLQAVRAVAVSKDSGRRLIVSASEDKTAKVWDRQGQKGNLEHPVAVRAVTCTPPTADTNLCLTGADDGIARLWDLDNLSSGKPLRELKGRHQSRIVSVAFAPDGKTCVTADEREIDLWDVGTGELRYRFPVQHKAPITYVQYTPQSKLVSVARDRSIILWKLGEKGAAPETVVEHRSGGVPVLGVSPDGQSVLFDQERALHVLTLPDKRTEGVLPAQSESSQFTTFALFSPDGRLVLAAGSADNPLQLWKAPAPGVRGHMIRRLASGSPAAPTCAAFAPDGSFAVTGTEDGKVLIWDLPSKAETDKQLVGEVSFLDPSIDAADRKARIRADLTNPEGTSLPPGDTVTLVIPLPEGR